MLRANEFAEDGARATVQIQECFPCGIIVGRTTEL